MPISPEYKTWPYSPLARTRTVNPCSTPAAVPPKTAMKYTTSSTTAKPRPQIAP